MGTVSFLLIVVALFGGGYTVLRRINSKSYLHGSPNKAVEHRRAPARKLVDQSISNRERRYVEWYLENGHKRQQARSLGPVRQPSAMVGVAFLSNDPEQQRRAGLA